VVERCRWNCIQFDTNAYGGEIRGNIASYFSDVGITASDVNDVIITNNVIFNGTYTEGYINSSWGIGVELSGDPAHRISISNNIIWHVQSGIVVSGNCHGTDISNNIITDTNIKGWAETQGGISIGSSRNVISSNWIETLPSTSSHGIYLTGDYNIIEANHITAGSRGVSIRNGATNNGIKDNMINASIGIHIVAGGNNSDVKNNDLSLCSTKVSDAGTDNIFKYNKGYVTENSGKTTVANGENVAHGLASTPVWASVTCLNATYGALNDPVIVSMNYTAFDATNIQVNVYWANGTAITDDAIDIFWDARTWN